MQSFTYAELQDLFAFPFRDPQWKSKLLIGSLISLAGFVLPFIPWIFIYGYGAQIIHRITVENGAPFLPEWDDWNKLFMDGLRLAGVLWIIMLPGLFILISGYGLMMVSPLIVAYMEADGRSVSPLIEMLPLIGMVLFGGSLGLSMLGGVFVGIVLPASLGHVVTKSQFAAAFRIKEWWPIFRANLGGFIVAYIILMGFSFAISFAFQILYFTIIFCCLMPFVMSAYTLYHMLIWCTLIGQTYRTGVDRLAAQPTNLP